MEITFGGAPKLNFIQVSPFNSEHEKSDISYPDSSFSFKDDIQLNPNENSIFETERNKVNSMKVEVEKSSKNIENNGTLKVTKSESFKNETKGNAKIIHFVGKIIGELENSKEISILKENRNENKKQFQNIEKNKNLQNEIKLDQNIEFLYENRDYVNKPKQKINRLNTSLFQMIFSKDITFFAKFKYIFIKLILVHGFVIFLTISKILFQDSIAKFCWMAKICLCGDDFQLKIFFSLFYIFTFWNLIILTLGKCAVEIVFQTSLGKIIVFSLYYTISFVFVFFYLLTVDENTFTALPLLIALTVFSSFIQMKGLFDFGVICKTWLAEFVKINGCLYLDLLHYVLCKRLFATFNESIVNSFSLKTARNLVKIYQLLYFTAYILIFKKLSQLYYDFIVIEKKNDSSSSIMIFRISLIFVISVPLSSLIDMKSDDWGCWIMMVSYIHFLISFYTRKSLFTFILKGIQKIAKFLFSKIKIEDKEKNVELEKTNESETECQVLISGCLLDVIMIVNSRLLILFISNRWLTSPNDIKFYTNCSFEVDENQFPMTLLGIISICVINAATTIIVIIYAFLKKTIIFEYKSLNSHSINIYFIFLLHVKLELVIQMFSEIN